MLFFTFAALWLAFGAAAATLMHRRGHDTFAWALLFLILGPLAIPVAVSSDRHPPAQPEAPSRDGDLDVLVADAGAGAGGIEAIRAALAVLDPTRITSVTLAGIVDVEAATTVRGRDAQREVSARLEAHAADLAACTTAPVDSVVLYGNPTSVLQSFAADHGYELIVTKPKSSNGPVPVLVCQEPS